MNSFIGNGWRWALALACLVGIAACDDGGSSNKSDAQDDAGQDASNDGDVDGDDDGGDGGGGLPTLAELPVGEWSEIIPGGDTTCAKGDPFKFYVYRGSSTDLALDFFGGGACWSWDTCNGSIYTSTVAEAEELYQAAQNGDPVPGIFDMENEANPIKGYTHVVVPYCTGDVHWGNAEVTYTKEGEAPLVIQHRGAVNAKSVFDWVTANVEAPDTVLTTGCSAGSYGAAMWSSHMMHAYPDAHQVLFGDSGSGVITQEFFDNELTNWGIAASFPTWIADFDLEHVTSLAHVYTKIADANPDAMLSQFNTANDTVQSAFYLLMGGVLTDWPMLMVASQEGLDEDLDNYRYFISPGSQHCVIDKANFYTLTSDGVKVVDWLDDLLKGPNPANVTCTECSE